MMDDIDVLRRMCAVLCGGTGGALTPLERASVREAKRLRPPSSRRRRCTLPGSRPRTN